MSTVKTGWLKNNNGEKFAPKTLLSQVVASDGVTFEDKIREDLDNTKEEILSSIENTVVKKAEHATSADSATTANTADHATSANTSIKATQDGDGKVISATYETKTDAQNKLAEAKEYADNKVANLLENSTEAVDSIYELRDAMNTNADAIEALTSISGSKADKEHSHDDRYYTETEIDSKFSAINDSISKISSGETVVKKAETATSATSATKDAAGNVITDTYETKDDANAKLEKAKVYTDTAIENIDFSKDYEQNDETHPEYIKNRPFYTGDEILQLVNSGSYSDPNNSGYNAVPFLEEGVTYKVIFDGQEYECTCIMVNDCLEIGNTTLQTEEIDATKEPFLFQDMFGMITFIFTVEAGDHSYEIYKKTDDIHVLDRKYIPYVAGERVDGKIVEYEGKNYECGTNAEVFNDLATNKAIGVCSHAEGSQNVANHWYAHAQGFQVKSSAFAAHAEGLQSEATGYVSHAEGQGTVATGKNQHVQGRYNISDTEDKYAHIVGNGEFYANVVTRSNAHTLDWNGNGWYAGNLYVGGTSQDDAMPLTTVQIIKLEDGD